MTPSFNLLPPLHPPGRSRTVPAWSALIALLIFLVISFFHSFLLREAINGLLWASQALTGITIHAETLPVEFRKPLHWKNVVVTFGLAPHQSRLEFQTVSLEVMSPRRIIFGDHHCIQKLEVSQGHGLIDLRHSSSSSLREPSFLENQAEYVQKLVQQKITELPESIILHDLSLLCITEKERCSVEHFSCSLPNKTSGNIAYESMLFEAGNLRCHLSKANCDALWDGKTITLKNLLLAEEMHLHYLQLTTHPDRLELGFVASLVNGVLRADGCLRSNSCGLMPMFEGAFFGEKLSIEHLAKFFGFPKKVSGMVREARLVFRGSPFQPMNAEASLRMFVDHFCFKKTEWASLSVSSHFIGRKISVTEFELEQQENRLSATGEMSLSENWSKIGEAPFHCKLQATIADASQLRDLLGSPWNNISGNMVMDGDLTGSANLAEGYVHLHGRDMWLHGLPIDAVESNILFQGEKTVLQNLDLWNGSNHLQLSGSIANQWPHDYQGEGEITCRNIVEKWLLLERWIDREHQETPSWLTSLLKNIHGGFFQAHWNGNGRAHCHEGSLKIGLEKAELHHQALSIDSSASYTPQLLSAPVMSIHLGDAICSSSLSLSPHAASFSNLTFQESGKTRLSAAMTLPINGIGLVLGHPLSSLVEWNTPIDFHVALDHFCPHLMMALMGLPQEQQKQYFSINGSIQCSGLVHEPSAAISLTGMSNYTSSSNNNTFLHVQLSSQKGEALIHASLAGAKDTWTQLQGTFPLGFIHLNQEAPLKEHDHPSIAPRGGPLHLDLLIPEVPLDDLAERLLPRAISLHDASIAGEVALRGTVATPQLSGHLGLKAQECTLGSLLPSLQELKAIILLSKEKISLEHASAFLGKGRVEASGVSKGNLGALYHEYHFLGHDLLVFQKEHLSIKGKASLLLQGDAQGGKLTGDLNITELDWKPQLTIVPFLLPPGILVEPAVSYPPEMSSWSSDVSLHYNSRRCELRDLHLRGPLLSPAPEGTLLFSQLSVQSPQGAMRFLKGGVHFSLGQPWEPYFDLSTEINIGAHHIMMHLGENIEGTDLLFESTPFLSQETAALLTATPRVALTGHFSLHDFAGGWMRELPFWIRQQEIEEPTTITLPRSSTSSATEFSSSLGFGGSAILYHAELQ